MMRRLLPFAAFLALALLLLAGVLMSGRGNREAIVSPLLGKPAPEFTLPVFGQPDRTVSRNGLLGKPYLLNVWGSWCPACRDEHPYITEIARSGRVRVIGYDYKDDPEEAQRWLEQFGNPYELVLVDADGLAALDWGIYGAPETFLVDGTGVVRWKHVGPIDRKVIEESLWPALESLP